MGKTTLLAFGLVVIATIQINAAPSPTAPVAAYRSPTYSGKGNCVTPTTKPKFPDSKHPLDEYVKAANNLKAWIETGQKGPGPDGKRGLEPHGNGEECLPIIKTHGALDVSLTDGGKDIYRNSYIEGYVPFRNAQQVNRGKGAVKPKPNGGKGKQKCKNDVVNIYS